MVMTWQEQWDEEREHIKQHRRRILKWIGALERQDLPISGWVKIACLEFAPHAKKPNCSSCGYRGLQHAVVIKYPGEALNIVVGPVCAYKATR